MNLYTLLNIEHFSNLKPPNAQQIEDILNVIITPELNKIGLDNKSKKYIWQSEYNSEGIKKIIQFSYRGTRGNFFVGTNFKSVPFVTQNKKLAYYNSKLHLSENSEYFDANKSITLWNAVLFEKSLKKYMRNNFGKKLDFLTDLETIEANIAFAQRQIDSTDFQYKIHHPSPKFVLIYLHEKLGNLAQAKKLKQLFLKENDDSDDIKFINLTSD